MVIKMKYVITGHLGLIGKQLKKRLDSAGHNCELEIDLRKGTDINDINELELEGVDIVFHLAAFCKINHSIGKPELAFKNNASGIYNVLEFCRINKVPKIVFFSSTRVLDKEKNPYVASKIYGEELVKAYHECYGIKYMIIRPSTVYGREDNTHRLMDVWIKNAKKDKPLVIYGDENKTLDFTYVDDFLDALEIALDGEWNKEHNISGKSELKLVDVAEEIIKQTKSKSGILFATPEISQPQNVNVKNTIDYTPKVDIKEGIRRCLDE
jgi:UDP-glucose 4-epimerase